MYSLQKKGATQTLYKKGLQNRPTVRRSYIYLRIYTLYLHQYIYKKGIFYLKKRTMRPPIKAENDRANQKPLKTALTGPIIDINTQRLYHPIYYRYV